LVVKIQSKSEKERPAYHHQVRFLFDAGSIDEIMRKMLTEADKFLSGNPGRVLSHSGAAWRKAATMTIAISAPVFVSFVIKRVFNTKNTERRHKAPKEDQATQI